MLGYERHILNLALAQRARGSAVSVIVDQPGVFSDACGEHGIGLFVVEGLQQEALLALFAGLDPQVIHCHLKLAATRAIPVGNRIRVPCVLTLHTNMLADGDTEVVGLFKAAKEAGFRFAAISVSKFLFDAVDKLGILGPHHYYVPNGTQQSAERDTSGQAGAASRPRPDFVSVGSLTANKGMDVAILALADLRRRRGDDCPVLNIFGAGGKLSFLQEMVTVLSLEDVVNFRGFQSEALYHCPSTHILVMSSRSETGPLVVLEAMSRGMPIVATDVGEVAEWLPGPQYGRVVPPDSIIALAEAMDSLLADVSSGCFDPQLLIDRHRSRYTSAVMAERVEAVYRQAVLSEAEAGAA
jgi:glycosyltransferase involved in cell wall biosynthesis